MHDILRWKVFRTVFCFCVSFFPYKLCDQLFGKGFPVFNLELNEELAYKFFCEM
jgi:hypothetical protein